MAYTAKYYFTTKNYLKKNLLSGFKVICRKLGINYYSSKDKYDLVIKRLENSDTEFSNEVHLTNYFVKSCRRELLRKSSKESNYENIIELRDDIAEVAVTEENFSESFQIDSKISPVDLLIRYENSELGFTKLDHTDQNILRIILNGHERLNGAITNQSISEELLELDIKLSAESVRLRRDKIKDKAMWVLKNKMP